jgi:NADPH:quinone reductase-like Zn-dependent oxidoreductase
MRAIVFDHYGDPDVMSLTEVPVPEPQDELDSLDSLVVDREAIKKN